MFSPAILLDGQITCSEMTETLVSRGMQSLYLNSWGNKESLRLDELALIIIEGKFAFSIRTDLEHRRGEDLVRNMVGTSIRGIAVI